jgi:hypothetical protein
MTKCTTSPKFKKELLSELLTNLNVDNMVVEDGIFIDVEKLRAIKKSEMPMMVFMNYDWILRCEKGLC